MQVYLSDRMCYPRNGCYVWPLVTDQHFLTLDQYKQPVQMHSFMLESTLWPWKRVVGHVSKAGLAGWESSLVNYQLTWKARPVRVQKPCDYVTLWHCDIVTQCLVNDQPACKASPERVQNSSDSVILCSAYMNKVWGLCQSKRLVIPMH